MTPCDEWEGTLSDTGYGRLYFGRIENREAYIYAHRLIWMQTYGHLESDEFVCHKCDNRRCIRLDHLFVGTQQDNMRDMVSKGRHWQHKVTACPKGHEYTAANTRIYKGGRFCRECNRLRNARDRARKAAA